MVENNNMQQLVNENENLVPTYGNDNNNDNTTTKMNDNIENMIENNKNDVPDNRNDNLNAENASEDDVKIYEMITQPTIHPIIASSCHGTDWYNETALLYNDVNGPIPYREWFEQDALGNQLTSGSNADERFSRVEVFCLMSPSKQLEDLLQYTNQQLNKNVRRVTKKGELLKLIGVIILMTK
jgi:hypothetical protein